jgi:hypothetical protein
MLPATMARIVAASTQSRSSSDSSEAMTRISTSGLENWRHNRRATLVSSIAATVFGPARARCEAACVLVRPAGRLCSSAHSVPGDWLHQASSLPSLR